MSLENDCTQLEGIIQYFSSIRSQIAECSGLGTMLQRPQGCVSKSLFDSLDILLICLKCLETHLSHVNDEISLKAITATVNENFFARMRDQIVTPDVFEFAMAFPKVVEEPDSIYLLHKFINIL